MDRAQPDIRGHAVERGHNERTGTTLIGDCTDRRFARVGVCAGKSEVSRNSLEEGSGTADDSAERLVGAALEIKGGAVDGDISGIVATTQSGSGIVADL